MRRRASPRKPGANGCTSEGRAPRNGEIAGAVAGLAREGFRKCEPSCTCGQICSPFFFAFRLDPVKAIGVLPRMTRTVSALVCASALALATASAGAAPAPRTLGGSRVHVVYPGQTLAMIAKRYNVSIDALCKANGITRRSPIRPKQRLVLPPRDGDVVPASLEKPEPEEARPVEKAGKADKTDKADKADRADKADKAEKADKASAKSGKGKSKGGLLVLQSYTGSWRGQVYKKGKITDSARAGIEKVLAAWRTGQHQPINDRLIRMLVKVSDHFGGKPIKVVSGYRPYSPTQYTPHSRHNSGHAVDFAIPGVPNKVLRDYCRTLANVGCGFYPNSSFVHLDVRETSAYWVDFSGPGQAPRYADAHGRDPGEAEREEPASGSGDGSGADDEQTFEPDEI